jgi:hypothetical protein
MFYIQLRMANDCEDDVLCFKNDFTPEIAKKAIIEYFSLKTILPDSFPNNINDWFVKGQTIEACDGSGINEYYFTINKIYWHDDPSTEFKEEYKWE